MVFQRIQQEVQDFYDQFYDILEKSDFSIPTFLAFGAAFQLLFFAYLPPRVATLIPLTWLAYRFIRSLLGSRDVFRTSFTDVKLGKFSARVPDSEGVVVFLLGARLNHPFGKLSPGTTPLDVVFKDMWREAEKNRVKWGYLGRTATLADTSDSEGTTTVWVTYWKDLKGLHEFAKTAAHRVGWDGYTQGKYPYVGVMHEAYFAPKGSYETIYGNFRKWGLGSTKVPSEGEDVSIKFTETLVPNTTGSTMFTRMGRSK